MKLISVKKDSQITLQGIKFDVVWTDGVIAQVTAIDGEGGFLVFKTESYNFRVMVKEPPKMVTKYMLKGSVAYCPVETIYAERHEAQDAMTKHQNMVASYEYCVLEIEEIQVDEAAV